MNAKPLADVLTKIRNTVDRINTLEQDVIVQSFSKNYNKSSCLLSSRRNILVHGLAHLGKQLHEILNPNG